jgi:hypothetical protein
VVVKRSIHQLTGTCTIKLPLSGVLKSSNNVSTPVNTATLLSKGDIVTVKLRYENMPEIIAFEGYVSEIDRTQPLVIECEDASWLFKRVSVKKAFQKINAIRLVEELLQGTGVALAEEVRRENLQLTLDQVQIQDQTVARVLKELKDNYLLSSWITRDARLYVGLQYGYRGKVVKYDLQKNIVKADSLKWQDKEDKKVLLKVTAFSKGGNKIEREFGDKDAPQRSMVLYDVDSPAEIESLAKAEWERYRYAGFRGDFETLLYPEVHPGDIAEITDKRYPERSVRYLIASVTTSFGMSGCRQKIEPDIKLS